jgi:hypothetical protein
MWWLIVAVIVGYIVFRFFSDREKMIKKIDNEGGMSQKYAILLSYLMAEPNSKITRLTGHNIELISTSGHFVNRFSILETASNLTIVLNTRSTIGDFTEKWEFPLNLNQHEMANKMDKDIEHKTASNGNSDELIRRINKAMDDFDNQ